MRFILQYCYNEYQALKGKLFQTVCFNHLVLPLFPSLPFHELRPPSAGGVTMIICCFCKSQPLETINRTTYFIASFSMTSQCYYDDLSQLALVKEGTPEIFGRLKPALVFFSLVKVTLFGNGKALCSCKSGNQWDKGQPAMQMH